MKLRFSLVLITALTSLSMWSTVPSRYYADANGKSGAALKTALCNIIYNHTEVSSYSALPSYFQKTDVYPEKYNGKTRWWDMYSNIPLYAPSFSGLNREHSFPKSWWGGITTIPAYVDLNHLYPSEMAANTAKSNYPLGTVSTATFDNGLVKVGYAVGGQGGGAAKVFEPADEYKGDFARTYFYMVTCYQNLTWSPSYMWMLQQNTYPTLSTWAQQLLLKWNEQDPVSQKEIDRNEQVYKIQNNRNPFIDYPVLAEYIWGDKKGELFYEEDATEPVGTPTLITPVNDMALEFNEVAIGNTASASLFFKGENLTGNLSLRIAGTNKAMFSVESSTVSSSLVNTSAGYWLKVYYKPTAVGEHIGKLTIYDGGITGSVVVDLRGQGCPVPTLTALNALPAMDITGESYTASWDEPAEVVDYYLVNRTRYFSTGAQVEQLLAETNSLVIDDYDPSVSESYNVQSVRLGYTSPVSNEIYITAGGIDAVEGDMPLVAMSMPGGVRFVTGIPHTDCDIYDMQGRTVMTLEVIENNSVIELPVGVYLVTTRECRRPVRVIVR